MIVPSVRRPTFAVVVVAVALLLPASTLAMGPVATHCKYGCGPHGTCRPGGPTPDSYQCVCENEWSGPDCSVPYVTCDDGKRRCYNNSECRRKETPDPETGEYGYKCDCSLAYGTSAFAGHECENSATQICEISTPLSQHAFCTNGGKCREYVLPGEVHEGCECPPEFEGEHCQYLKGTAPAEELERKDPDAYRETHASQKTQGRIGAGGILGVIVLMLGVFSVAVYAQRRKFLAKEGVERNYIESLAQDDVDEEGGGEKEEEYSLEGRRDVELASGSIAKGKKRTKEPIAASMHLDPDGSSTMPSNGKTTPADTTSGKDRFDEEAQSSRGNGTAGEMA